METKSKRPTTEQQIETLTTKLEKVLTRKIRADYATQEKDRAKARQQAQANRRADAHKKIQLGGLVIVANAQNWDEAMIVGALLAGAQTLLLHPDQAEIMKRNGMDAMLASKARH